MGNRRHPDRPDRPTGAMRLDRTQQTGVSHLILRLHASNPVRASRLKYPRVGQQREVHYGPQSSKENG
jgi:hypothetical protein